MGVDVGRARILRSAPQGRGYWRKAADAFGRQRKAGITACVPTREAITLAAIGART